MKRSKGWMILIVLLIAALPLAACSQQSADTAVKPDEPAHVEPIAGTELNRVVLTERAAERLGIQMDLVREEQVVRNRSVEGKVVAALEVGSANPNRVWVRVSLPEPDRNQVDRSRPARVLLLDEEDDDGTGGLTAEPDEGPDVDDLEDDDLPREDVAEALYYLIDSAEHPLAPGQQVLVELSLLDSGTPRTVIPYAAVLYDLHGGTWVYTSPEPRTFVRHPVSVDYIEDDLAFLSDGPAAGTAVATVGVAELYGTDTGVGK